MLASGATQDTCTQLVFLEQFGMGAKLKLFRQLGSVMSAATTRSTVFAQLICTASTPNFLCFFEEKVTLVDTAL